jgi:hypothetical protein
MKITKRQLRRIIKEEKAKLVRETVGDMSEYENLIEQMATQLSNNFGEDMMSLFDEDPGMFDGRSTKDEWQEQVTYAQQELDTGIATAIQEKIEEVEMMLHDGQYQRGF